jgi:hypothetical protein
VTRHASLEPLNLLFAKKRVIKGQSKEIGDICRIQWLVKELLYVYGREPEGACTLSSTKRRLITVQSHEIIDFFAGFYGCIGTREAPCIHPPKGEL